MISVVQLGLVDYATALDLQQSMVELRQRSRIRDTLLLLEHPPVITLGRNAHPQNLLASRELLSACGVELFECNRGGDITFHGPGQLIGYPIFDLRSETLSDLRVAEKILQQPKKSRMGAVDFVRGLEEVLIRTCVEFGVGAQRIKGLTGVWTTAAEPAKVAAIGVHISRGVTSHGFALNMTNDLEYFKLIVPCGIAGRGVTSIEKETGGSPKVNCALAGEMIARNFGRVFASQILWLELLDALLAAGPGDDISSPEDAEIDDVPDADSPANQDIPLQIPDEIRQVPGEQDPSQGPSKDRFWA